MKNNKLNNIVNWLNSNYNPESENYSIFTGAKPEVIKYDEHTAISLWACGAIVCDCSIIYFIQEDDGNWFIDDEGFAYQSSFSIGWAKSFREAMERLEKYVEENGHPVYYSGIKEKIICHYTL